MPDPEQALDRLRRLLVAPEQARLQELEERPRVAPETLARVLPEAVAAADRERGEELAIALEPPVKSAVGNLIHKEGATFGALLAPAIGAAVRRAVADALRTMVERLNVIVERIFSPSALRWRLEAARTGRPLAEVALLRSLVYRVEQVFLIHAPTGLLLEHVEAEGVSAADPDQVAALMSAIDAFARDAFEVREGSTHLGQFELGELTCWVEWGPQLLVAAVVRGVAPRSFADQLRATQEELHLQHRHDLAVFRSDTRPFEAARPTLERCLMAQTLPPSRAGGWLALGLVLVAVIGMLFWAHSASAGRARLDHLAAALRSTPGLVVLEATRQGHHYRFTGLKDPLAEAPDRILARHGVAGATLRFEPFMSLDPALVEARARRLAEAARPALLAELEARGRALGRVDLPFRPGSAAVAGLEPALSLAAELARQYHRAAARLGQPYCLVAIGDADARGSETRNAQLARARARAVLEALRARGVPADHLAGRVAAQGGTTGAAGQPLRGRRVTLEARTARCGDLQ